jgi:uncharacterized membrane protein YozB (DUF420 family)
MGGDAGRPATGSARGPWWRRPWIIPLALVVVGFLVYQASLFRVHDQMLPPHENSVLYYPVLLGHIGFGTIAMIAVVLQVWPWLRRNHPRVHRVSGRIYIVSALISASCALYAVTFIDGVGRLGFTIATLIWMATTVIAYIRVRQGRYAQHRRFMLYSFALMMNGVWGVVIVNIGLELGANYESLLEAARWGGWVTNLMLVQWWLYHTDPRPEILPENLAPALPGRA